MNIKGLVIVVVSPSGGGKGTILREVMSVNEKMRFSVSATTRNPREGEIEGEHYYFVSREKFETMIAGHEMLEYAEYCGNYYGTPIAPVEKWVNEGHDVILEIEVQGCEQIKNLLPDCVTIFILPPSMEVLEKRLRRRGTESEEVLQGRLKTALSEIKYAEKADYIVINDKLEDAVEDFNVIIKAEKLKVNRNLDNIKGVLNNA